MVPSIASPGRPSSYEEYEEAIRPQLIQYSHVATKLTELTADEAQNKAAVSTEHYPNGKDPGVVEFVFTLLMTHGRMEITHVKEIIDAMGVELAV